MVTWWITDACFRNFEIVDENHQHNAACKIGGLESSLSLGKDKRFVIPAAKDVNLSTLLLAFS